MRVITGLARGRRLKEPEGQDIRPTSGAVKEAIFNIVQFHVQGSCVLDLFAGTGQFGIEALSRGAKSVEFVDSLSEAAKLIKENLKICGFSDTAEVHARDALKYLENHEKFDLIFMDPPYESDLAYKALSKIIEFDKLNINGIIICETKAGSTALNVSPPYAIKKVYKYGGVKITRCEREG